MNSTSIFILVAKISSARFFLILGDMQGMAYKLIDTLVPGRRNGHHRNAQHVFHFIYMYSSAVAANLVHHVQCQHHRRVQLHELHGQIKISFYVGCIHYIDDACRLLVENELSRHDFLAGIRGKGVDARKVCHQCLRMIADGTAFLVYCHSWKVSHMLV